MKTGLRRLLRKFLRTVGVELVPGYRLTSLELIRFRRHLLGEAAPLRLYGRWRQLMGGLVSAKEFYEAGLDNLHETYPGKIDRQIVVMQALRNMNGLEGAVVELGTYQGHTAVQLAQTMRSIGDTSPLYLFDSFQGLPESEGTWNQGDLRADLNAILRRFQRFENVTIVPGYFADTLPEYSDIQVKLAHVDADLYSSTKDANSWLLDRVTCGGVVIYDDYGFPNTEGVKQAVDEDFTGRCDYHQYYLPTGQLLAIRCST